LEDRRFSAATAMTTRALAPVITPATLEQNEKRGVNFELPSRLTK
jgi:hypothetical protein